MPRNKNDKHRGCNNISGSIAINARMTPITGNHIPPAPRPTTSITPATATMINAFRITKAAPPVGSSGPPSPEENKYAAKSANQA